MRLIKMLCVDWMKIKRTPIRLIAYMTPIVYSICMIMYNKHNKFQIQNYDTFFNAMAIILPIGIALISALICEQEENAGNFNGLLSIPTSRIKIYTSKLIMLILIITIDIIVSTIMMIWGLKFIIHMESIDYKVFMQGALFMSLASVAICSLDLLISFMFGMGASIGIGAMGVLIAAILGATPVGDSIWMFIPWTYPARLGLLPGTFINGAYIPVNTNSVEYFNVQLQKGILSISIFFILITILGIIWFEKWEGKKSYD
ncbi:MULTISPECIES: lantibiotic immunity ABC transporter MutG family permease subunit [unclassified Clostridium]|uniref:lantibiotic immunity ABC transporter MutG family permease subunit n=1 Tax=unclassified Clostridium TaxID=2614128 RepID=UPI000297C786|nr:MULTISPECIES: lantibiotic immunity ABC transporter MutG family permease subunit [unclassified Clostridium]EKQ50564.1 MAG: lantibiotic protection ABC transporter permease subunit, MutG family [Clostridium sp. Maddingley MBC34-26]